MNKSNQKAKWTEQDYYNQIGELKARNESKKFIIYEGLKKVSPITHDELERLLEIGRIQYIRTNLEGKLKFV